MPLVTAIVIVTKCYIALHTAVDRLRSFSNIGVAIYLTQNSTLLAVN